MDEEHSILLKYFVKGDRSDSKTKMADVPIIKIEKEYQNPPNVESEVPGTHEIREADKNTDINNCSQEITVTNTEFTLSPVITVTKNESTFTKGDLKLQKVTVTEDISVNVKNVNYQIADDIKDLSFEDQADCIDSSSDVTTVNNMEGEEKSHEEKKSKIPLLRLKQAVERVKEERQTQKEKAKPRRSSIPKLKDPKKLQRDTSLNFEPQVDDEFEKLYEEIVEDKPIEIETKLSIVTIDDPEKIETKFEELIQSYDEDDEVKPEEKPSISKVSKIPALRRKEDSPSLKALMERVKEVSVAETKIKDGGFKVTSSTIRTKRFSRGNSEITRDEQRIDLIEEVADDQVFEKEKDVNVSKSDKKSSKAKTIRNKAELLEQHRQAKLREELRRKQKMLRNGVDDSVLIDNTNDNIDDLNAVLVKTERIVRNISREINDDKQSITNTETVTTEKLHDEGKRTITTKTTEIFEVGTPVVEEKVIRYINREGTENTGVTIEEKTRKSARNTTTGIPIKTERFTRDISREMGNFKQSVHREISQTKDDLKTTDDEVEHKPILKKETMKVEQIEKEGVKVGIPVFTKITRSYSKGKIQNVEMSRTVEWKPADVITNKAYTRSVSEKVTKKELNDTNRIFKTAVSENNANDIKRDTVIENNIKETVKQAAKTKSIRKITEFKTEEQVTNEERTKFTLSKSLDLSLDSNFKTARAIGTQMSVDGQNIDKNYKIGKDATTKISVIDEKIDPTDFKPSREIGTQISVDITKAQEAKHKEINKKQTKIEKSEMEDSNPLVKERDGDITVTNLKGNVSRMKEKIANDKVTVSQKDKNEEFPKKKSVLNKIAMFERLEKDPVELPLRKLKCKYVPPTRTTYQDEEVITAKEEPQSQPNTNEDKVEISVTYDAVAYTNEPVIVKEYLKSEYDGNLVKDDKVATIVENDKIGKDETAVVENDKTNEDDLEYIAPVAALPEIVNLVPKESPIEIPRTPEPRKNSEMPTIFPPRRDYDSDIGRTRPGKLNLGNWTNQVEINKSTVDKVAVFKEEQIQEIVHTLPGIDIKAYASQVSVSKELPRSVDGDKEKPVKVRYDNVEIQMEATQTVAQVIDVSSESNIEINDDYKLGDDANVLSQEKYNESYDLIQHRDTALVSTKIEDEFLNLGDQTQDNREVPEDIVKSRPKPGKLDLRLWENQVEANRSHIGKDIKNKPKNTDITPGKKVYRRTSDAVQEKSGLNNAENKDKTPITDADNNYVLQMESATLDKVDVVQEKNDRINDENKVQTPKTDTESKSIIKTKITTEVKDKFDIVQEKNDPISDENKVQTSKTQTGIDAVQEKMSDSTYRYSITDSDVSVDEIYTTSSESDYESPDRLGKPLDKQKYLKNVEKPETRVGKLDLSLWKNQVEENRKKPKTTEIITEALSKKVFKPYNRGLSDAAQRKNDFNNADTKDDIPKTEIEVDIETVLPETIETEQKVETAKPIIAFIDVNKNETTHVSNENDAHEEPPKILKGKVDLKINKRNDEIGVNEPDTVCFTSVDYVEPVTTLPAIINFKTEDIKVENPKPGKLNLKAWEDQVEANKVLVDKIEDIRNKYIEDVAKTLTGTGTVEFVLFEEAKYQKRFDLNENKNKVDIPETDNDLEADIDLEDTIMPDSNIATLNYLFPRRASREIQLNEERDKAQILNELVSESLSDPELVDEPVDKRNSKKDAVIGSVKRKLFFLSSLNRVQNPVIREDISEKDDDDTKTDGLETKAYLINELGQKLNAASVEDIEAHTIEEYKLITPPNTAQIETADIKDVVNGNVFHFDVTRVENRMTKSVSEVGEFKNSREDMKRTKSLAELDLGDVVQGKVKRILNRINSIDFGRRASFKTEINIRELPRRMTVLEKIALFEGKLTSAQPEPPSGSAPTDIQEPSPGISEEAYLQRLQELQSAKAHYGQIESMNSILLCDGTKMPVMAIGTALLDSRLLKPIIGAAIDMGYRAIDTGYIYGNEKEVGEAIQAKIDDGTVTREQLFIMGKLWSTFHKTDLVETACRNSLEALGITYFDLYMIHNPMSFKEGPDPIPKIASVIQFSEHDYLDAWFGMEGLISKGLAKSIGVSNFNSVQLKRILEKGKIQPVVNQVECHPYLSQQRLDAFCRDYNIMLSCYGALGSKGTPAEYKNSSFAVIDDPLVKVMASGLGVSPAQLLLRYQIDSGHNVVVKASRAAHLWDNLQALSFELDDAQLDALHALNKNKRNFVFKGMGETHKNYPFLEPF